MKEFHMAVNDMEYQALVFAPFGPSSSLGRFDVAELATLDDLDAAMASLAGTFRVEVPQTVCPDRAVTVPVAGLADLRPAGIARRCPYLGRILEASALCDQVGRAGLTATALAKRLAEDYGDLPLDLSLAAPAGPAAAAPSGGAAIDAILDMVATDTAAPSAASSFAPAGVAGWKGRLAGLATSVLGAVLADPTFRAAEAAWRGVRLILQNAGPDSVLRLHLVSAEAEALPEALARLTGAPPKRPPNLILADAFLDAAPARLETWTALAEAADALLAPTAVALAPAFFHLDGWEDLSRIGYPARALDEAAFAKWRKLAAEPGGAWLTALFLRAALRPAYGPDNPARVAAVTEPGPLWGSPVWLLGAAVAASLARSGWPHRFEIGQGVTVGDLAVAVSRGRGTAVEILLPDDRILDFAKVGLAPLTGQAGGDQAFFRHTPTLDGSPLSARLFLNRSLGVFLGCRADAALEATLAEAGLTALATAIRDRFALFFQATGHPAPVDLAVDAAVADGGTRLAVGFTPPPGLASSPGRLEFSFAW
jgi:hypothetical protein